MAGEDAVPEVLRGEALLRQVLTAGGVPLVGAFAEHIPSALATAAAEGTLLPHEAPIVESHIEDCPACRRLVEARRSEIAPRRTGLLLVLLRRPAARAAAAAALVVLAGSLVWRALAPAERRATRDLLALLDASGPTAARGAAMEYARTYPRSDLAAHLTRSLDRSLMRAPRDGPPAADLYVLDPRFAVMGGSAPTFVWADLRPAAPDRRYRLIVTDRDDPGAPLLEVDEPGQPVRAVPLSLGEARLLEFRPGPGAWRAALEESRWFLFSVQDAAGGRRAEGQFRLLDAGERRQVQEHVARVEGMGGGFDAARRFLRASWLGSQALQNHALFAQAIEDWEALRARFPRDPVPVAWLEQLYAALEVQPLAEAARGERERLESTGGRPGR